MGLLDWLRYGPPMFARPTAAAPAPERKLTFVGGYNAAMIAEPLIHGPGATDILNARNGNDGNSAVFACLGALATGYVEPPLRVYRETDPGTRDVVPDHPLQALLDVPNPFMSALEVWSWVTWAKHLDGNAYLRKERSGRTNVIALWPMSPSRVEIRSTDNEFISAYRWHYGPGVWQDLKPADVIHFRLGLDDCDPRKGLAPLRRLLRAITTDERASSWTDTLLSNYALPGMVIKTKGHLSPQDARELAETAQWLYGEERRGKVGVIGGDADMQQYGFSPEQMVLEALHKIPESRISAVLRVPAIIAGLGVGLDAATYSNARQLREFFTETTLVGLWAQDEAKLQTQLVPDFTKDKTIKVLHDLTDVRAFQEDESAKYERLKTAVGGPFITINEARSDVGLAPLPDGDVLFVPNVVTAVPTDAIQPPPKPEPLPGVPTPEGSGAEPDGAPPEPIPLPSAASRLLTLVKADEDAPPVQISRADIDRAREWADGLDDAPALQAALGGGKARRNGHARH